MKRRLMALCCMMIAFAICFAMMNSSKAQSKSNVSTATAKVFYAEKNESTDEKVGSISGMVSGYVSELDSENHADDLNNLGESLSGFGDSLSGFGDSLGGIAETYSGIGDSLGGVVDSIGGIGDSFSGIGSGLGDGLGSGLGNAIGGVFGNLFGDSNTTTEITTVVPTTSPQDGLIVPVPAATQEEKTVVVTVYETVIVNETVTVIATSNPYIKPAGTFVAGDKDETIKWLQWIFVYTGYGLEEEAITGVLDDATIEVVKKLQRESGLPVDGNVNNDVIKAAETLYYQSAIGKDLTAVEVSLASTVPATTSNQTAVSGNQNSITVALLVIVLVIIWVLAIGGIILLFVFRKKKIAKEKSEEAPAEKNNEQKSDEISGLSDLFEEADKNSK